MNANNASQSYFQIKKSTFNLTEAETFVSLKDKKE